MVHQELLDHLVLLGPLEIEGCLDYLVPLDQEDSLGHLDHREKGEILVNQGKRDLLVLQDLKGLLVLLEPRDKGERRVLLENKEHLAWQEDLGTRDLLVGLGLLDHLDPLASLDHLASLDRLDGQEKEAREV